MSEFVVFSKDFSSVIYFSHECTITFVGENSLKDLGHTFVTRAKECGVSPELVSTWVGHDFEEVKRGKVTSTVYTHFSNKFQQMQAQKLRYYEQITE